MVCLRCLFILVMNKTLSISCKIVGLEVQEPHAKCNEREKFLPCPLEEK